MLCGAVSGGTGRGKVFAAAQRHILSLSTAIAGVLLAHATAWIVDLSGTITRIVRYPLSTGVVAFVQVVYAAVVNPDTIAQFLRLVGLIPSAAILGSAATLWSETWLALHRRIISS